MGIFAIFATGMMQYREYGQWLREQLGVKAQKISLDAGFSCPNRDGRLGHNGCTFCSNPTFSPAYCRTMPTLEAQLEAGKSFFARKYPDMKYLAYFQAYTNTYGDTERCISLYERDLKVPDIVGLVVATRPDCMSADLLDYFAELNRRTFLVIEYGIESANDDTLRHINRGHTFADAERAVRMMEERGIRVGAHLILGLPGEGYEELMRQARLVGQLPLTIVKLHQLQIIRGTQMEKEWQDHPWPLPSVEEYIEWVLDYISLLPPSFVFERFVSSVPDDVLVAPRWGLKNHEFSDLLRSHINDRSFRQHVR